MRRASTPFTEISTASALVATWSRVPSATGAVLMLPRSVGFPPRVLVTFHVPNSGTAVRVQQSSGLLHRNASPAPLATFAAVTSIVPVPRFVRISA